MKNTIENTMDLQSVLTLYTSSFTEGFMKVLDNYNTPSSLITEVNNEIILSKKPTLISKSINKGFEKLAARSTATVILQQAKIDNVNVFEIIDTLKGLNKIQLSEIVAEILNYDRNKVSTLGFRSTSVSEKLERRNIVE